MRLLALSQTSLVNLNSALSPTAGHKLRPIESKQDTAPLSRHFMRNCGSAAFLPAMDHLHASRTSASLIDIKKKSLRTYGKKRTLQTGDVPASTDKRRRLTQSEPELPPFSLSNTQSTSPAAAKLTKGSILNYFKPCRSSSGTDSMDISSDPQTLSSTPPSSPPVTDAKRTPRRLRLRPATPVIASFATENATAIRACQETAKHPTHSKGQASQTTTKKTGAVRSTLQQSPDTTLNSQLPNIGIEEKQKSNTTRSKSAPVQTTINLSTKPAFEECKACHIVYNPLHPKDVKYHAQRHKTIMRSQSKE